MDVVRVAKEVVICYNLGAWKFLMTWYSSVSFLVSRKLIDIAIFISRFIDQMRVG